jgi:hypothetical protein
MPRRRSKLNTRQLEVLKWMADGCPDGVMEDFTYKTTAVALQSRGLVSVRRTRDGWTALVTPAGEHYADMATTSRDRPIRPVFNQSTLQVWSWPTPPYERCDVQPSLSSGR